MVLPILLNDLVKYECVPGRTPECVEDPEKSWMTTEQFYAGLGIVQVRARGCAHMRWAGLRAREGAGAVQGIQSCVRPRLWSGRV